MAELFDYEIDDLNLKCPECFYTEYQELCDIRPKGDGDTWIKVCENCGAKLEVTFCVSYDFKTTLLEKKAGGRK